MPNLQKALAPQSTPLTGTGVRAYGLAVVATTAAVAGQLVAGVAHNFNNLLTVTMGYTDILLERHGDHDPDHKDLREIRTATERGAALVRQLLAFGRKHDGRLARIDLNGTVAGLHEMLTRVIREDIQLTIDVEPAPVAVLIQAISSR